MPIPKAGQFLRSGDQLNELLKINSPVARIVVKDKNQNPINGLTIAGLYEALTPPRRVGETVYGERYLYHPRHWVDEKFSNTLIPLDENQFKLYEVDNKGFFPPGLPPAAASNPEFIRYYIYSQGKFEPEDSADKFYITYENRALANQKSVQVELKSYDAEGNILDSSKITLYSEPENKGVFRSSGALVLVSNRAFDQHSINEKPDNSSHDQTFYAQLDGRLTITHEDKSLPKPVVSSLPIPAQKILTVYPIVFKDEKGHRLANKNEIQERFTRMQESLAPTKIKIVVAKPIILNQPTDEIFKKASPDEKAKILARLVAQQQPMNHSGMQVIFAGDEVGAAPITDQFFVDNEVLRNGIFIQTHGSSQEPGHKAFHFLLQSIPPRVSSSAPLSSSEIHAHYKYYSSRPLNLMSALGSDDDSPTAKLFGPEHLTPSQRNEVLKSASLVEVPPSQRETTLIKSPISSSARLIPP
jgi:hypothetical protein